MLAKARDLVISGASCLMRVEFIMHSIIATLRDYFETEPGVWLVDADAATEEREARLSGPTAIIAMEEASSGRSQRSRIGWLTLCMNG